MNETGRNLIAYRIFIQLFNVHIIHLVFTPLIVQKEYT